MEFNKLNFKVNLVFIVTLFVNVFSFAQITVSTLAGSTGGNTDGTGGAAQFGGLYDIATDASGNLYVTDDLYHNIRKITPTGVVTTLAGGTYGYADGTGSAAQFAQPKGIVLDSSGNIFVVDQINLRIRKITPTGVVTTFAGNGVSDVIDGTGTAASFATPTGLAIDISDNLYVADGWTIRKITPGGVVTTLAGSLPLGYEDGTGAAAKFRNPEGLAVDASGNVYVADYGNNKIRKITPAGVVTTFAGQYYGNYGYQDGTNALFYGPHDVEVDNSGNVYVTDYNNSRIRKITSTGETSTFAGIGPGYADGLALTEAMFYYPTGITLDASGIVYVADKSNTKIRKIGDVSLSTSSYNVSELEIYPNPSNGVFYIKNVPSGAVITVYDIFGKQIVSKNATFDLIQFDLSDYSKGFYIVKIFSEDKQICNFKLIKE
ncbi:T9SS type A sorting domain-containing protein [Flavobacterium okayamense]|uniref:Secretion system C-terminal sorting domain-containing protein n=1 Tax=Flavobacterium okayamense TaxID=2830782 RepID=A0ABN6I1Q9_9FLAO|nr:T9SS type A sorting domain-containing protein [Flavobacterium okayamense]BCY28403.1 hypothetical protein KK2020170_12710 [Flavobacterium okayamense]